MKILAAAAALLFLSLACAALPAQKPVYVLDLSPMALRGAAAREDAEKLWDTLLLAACIQGIANRRSPEVYLIFTGTEASEDGSCDRFWLSVMEKGFLKGRPQKPVRDVWMLTDIFRSRVKGLCVYDPEVPATCNAAVTAAGCEDLLCVRYDPAPSSAYSRLRKTFPVKRWLIGPDGSRLFTGRGAVPGTDLPSSGSAKCDAYLWAKAKYLDTGRCDPSLLGYYIDACWLRDPAGRPSSCALGNRDLLISRRGFCFDLSPWDDEIPGDEPDRQGGSDPETLKSILRSCWEKTEGKKLITVCGFLPWDKKYSAVSGGRHGVVEGEWKLAEILSSHNACLDADAINYCGMCNASFFRWEPLRRRYPQTAPRTAEARAGNKCYVCFYAGDYDSAAWMYQNLPAIWNDPARGGEPMCWGFNPNLAGRFPTGFNYVRGTATDRDWFVGGDSGAGYINPGFLAEPRPSGLPSGVSAWAGTCARWYRQFDLDITGFLLEGNAPPMTEELWDALESFSPMGAAGMYMEEAGLRGRMPFALNRYDLIDFDKTRKEANADAIARLAREKTPCFLLVRHILWTPSEQKEFMELLSGKGEFVQTDIYTFMALVKDFCQKGGVYTPLPSDNLFFHDRIRVEGHSPLFAGCDVRDAFEGRFGAAEKGGILFADTGAEEYYLEWAPAGGPAPGRIEVLLQADDTGERQAESLTLQGRTPEGWRTLLEQKTEPYSAVTLGGSVDARGVTAYRLTLTKRAGCRLAPRIKEIRGTE